MVGDGDARLVGDGQGDGRIVGLPGDGLLVGDGHLLPCTMGGVDRHRYAMGVRLPSGGLRKWSFAPQIATLVSRLIRAGTGSAHSGATGVGSLS